jgi:phage N-6-adenine-methyltransferase
MSNDNVSTPDAFFKAVQEYFGITFRYDMASNDTNFKCMFHFTEEENSLSCDWPTTGWLWLNPPYSKLKTWIEKCQEQASRGCRIVSIWPLSADRNVLPAWQHSDVFVIHGRVFREVRSIMLCRWTYPCFEEVKGLTWDGTTLARVW